MTLDLAQRAVDMFIYLAEGATSVEFVFTGGEPLLQFPLLRELVAYIEDVADNAQMNPGLVVKTNGTILTPEIVEFFRQHRVRVVVSIDGPAEVHDLQRRSLQDMGTYTSVSHNMLSLINNEVECTASLTVHPQLSASVLSNVQHLHRLGVRTIDVGPAYGTVTWNPVEAESLASSLMAIASYMREVNGSSEQLVVGPLYRESEHVAEQLRNSWGCRAASSNLAVLPDGRVTGCSSLAMLVRGFPELVVGSVSEGLDEGAVARLCDLAQAGPARRSACQQCQTGANCSGGCLAINYASTGRPLDPPQFYCGTIAAIPAAWRCAWTHPGPQSRPVADPLLRAG